MASNHELRLRARASLGFNLFGNPWLLAVLAVVILGAIASLATSVVVGSLLVLGPLGVGSAAIFLGFARGRAGIEATDFIKGFANDFVGSFLLGLLSALRIFLWSLLFFIPGIVKAYAYSMIYLIKNDHPNYTWRQCLAESERLMVGRKWQLFCLDLSFLGWFILGSLCLGVGTLWVIAYQNAARAQFYESIK